MKTFTRILPAILFFILIHCGTEIGNPSIIDVDLGSSDNTVGYFSNVGTIQPTTTSQGLMSTIRALTPAEQDFNNAPLLKLSSTGVISAAIRVSNFKSGSLPKVVRMTKLLNNNGNIYVLFDQTLNLSGQLCRLVEITTENILRCVDSETHPAHLEGPNYRLSQADDKKDFLVAFDTATSKLYYKTTNTTISEDDYSMALSDAAGTQRITNSTYTFDRVIQKSDGSIIGLGCHEYNINTNPFFEIQVFEECLIQTDSVTNLSGAIIPDMMSNLEARVFDLRNDRALITVSEPAEDFHLRTGPLGEVISLSNFSTDLKTTPSLNLSITTPLHYVYENTNGDIWGLYSVTTMNSLSQFAVKLGPNYVAYDFTNKTFDAFDHIDGSRGVIVGTNSNGIQRVISVDHETYDYITLPSLDIDVTAARLIATDQVVFSGKSLTSEIYKYYLYDLGTLQETLLFTTTEFVDVHVL